MTTTATENVFILAEQFYLPSLARHRRLWVYLPADYQQTDERYPVIYMHDGQNLFDESNAFGSEWGIDETLDAEQGKVIVVGIDNGEEHRLAEYRVHDHEEHGNAEGGHYLKDIVEVIKPFIDNTLRTRAEREATCVAGSSMGGLISVYAGLYFPHVFGAAGIFSPSLWLAAPGIFAEVQDVANRANELTANIPPQRWYFYAGAGESETMINEVATMVKIIREIPHMDVTYQFDINGVHDEAVWKNYFPGFYQWFIGKKPAEVLEQESHIRLD